MMKSLIDVIFRRRLKWTSAHRIGTGIPEKILN
jgi:hypothetical protein